MPAARLRPEFPTVYLDWSTLLDGFKGIQLNAAAADRSLADALSRASRAANLCMSFVHLYELMRWRDEQAREECSTWLDHLDVVWLRLPEEVHELELENLLRGVAAGRPDCPGVPAAPSFLSLLSLHEDAEALSFALQRNRIRDFVHEIGASRLMPKIERMAAESVGWSQRLWQDHVDALATHSEEEMRIALDRKRNTALLGEALRIHQRLVLDPSYYVERGGLLVPPDESFVRAALTPLPELKRFLPYAYLQHRARQNRSFALVRRPSADGKRFVAATRGDIFDHWHLVGAAYCDVFTCDAATSESLAHGREELGRAPELVRAGPVDVLASQIKAALA